MDDGSALYTILGVFIVIACVIMLLNQARQSRKGETRIRQVDEINQTAMEVNRRSVEVLERADRLVNRIEVLLDRLEHRQ